MKKPTTILVKGLGHPEGPCQLDDGRVIYANTYGSEIGVWDPRTNTSGQYAFVGGGPNACVLGSDGAVYSTQTPTVGDWVAPVHRPPSIQKTSANGKVEVLVTEADGRKFRGPNDLVFGKDGKLYFTDSGDWDPVNKPHEGLIVCVETDGTAHIIAEPGIVYPNGIVAEADGSIVWVESYTMKVIRRTADGKTTHIHTLPDNHVPDGLKCDVDGNLWIASVASGGVDIIRPDGTPIDFLEVGSTILNITFGKDGALYCCDMGVYDTSGSPMTGTLTKVDVGVQGMPLFRGQIG